jgi:hypothetical protein
MEFVEEEPVDSNSLGDINSKKRDYLLSYEQLKNEFNHTFEELVQKQHRISTNFERILKPKYCEYLESKHNTLKEILSELFIVQDKDHYVQKKGKLIDIGPNYKLLLVVMKYYLKV